VNSLYPSASIVFGSQESQEEGTIVIEELRGSHG